MCKRTDQGHDYHVFYYDHYKEAFHVYDDVDDDDYGDGHDGDDNFSEGTGAGCTSSSVARLGFVGMLSLAWLR